MEWISEWRFAKKFRFWVVGVRAKRRSIFWVIEEGIFSFSFFSVLVGVQCVMTGDG